MKKTALTMTLFAALGVSACQAGGGNNSTNAATNESAEDRNEADGNNSVDVNTSAIGESIENTASEARNAVGPLGDQIENGLEKTGDAIENTASSATREVREATDGDGRQRETNEKNR